MCQWHIQFRATDRFRDSIVVSISACHAEDPGSIPGCGIFRRVDSPLAFHAEALGSNHVVSLILAARIFCPPLPDCPRPSQRECACEKQ